MQGGSGVGTDKSGGIAYIIAGVTTGTALSSIVFRASATTTVSGTGSNATGTIAQFSRTGTLAIGTNYSFVANASGAANATTAVDGYVYVGSCAGTPTGVPTAFTGANAITVDTSNNLMYFYSGGSWRPSNAGPTADTLAAVLAVGATTGANNITFSSSQNANWATGGTFSASAPEILGPTDTGMFITSGLASSAVGRTLTLTAGAGNGSGNAGGTLVLTAGAGVTGNAAGGDASFTAGAGVGSSAGGAVTVTGGGGTGTGVGGTVTVSGGTSNAGLGGNATFKSGTSVGTNVSGTNVLINAGPGTGTAIDQGSVNVQTSFPSSSSGSVTGTLGDRIYVSGKTKLLSNTNTTATVFATVSNVSSLTAVGYTCFYTVQAYDGTDISMASGTFGGGSVNKAGTVTAGAISALVNNSTAASSGGGTLSVLMTQTVSSTLLQLTVTPTWTTITPTVVLITYTIVANGPAVVVPQ